MKIRFCLILAMIGLWGAQEVKAQSGFPVPALPSIPKKVFNIKDFGAVSDDKTDNTAAIQKAITAAGNAGGGMIVVPAGTYLLGPLQLNSSNLQLQIDSGAILKF